MIILGIETSCDETALSLIETSGQEENLHFKILGNELISQAKIHEQYGGVFPVVAKREHGKNLIPLFLKLLKNSKFEVRNSKKLEKQNSKLKIIESILDREKELKELFLKTLLQLEKPRIDRIAVTTGPGLEPALWVGICFARALGELWNIPVVAVNHMEGHILSALISGEIPNNQFPISNKIEKTKLNATRYTLNAFHYPALALLISGGHTELVLIRGWKKYEVIGKTRDDAVGEAFDKVARILGLPYPGGPQISALAEKQRKDAVTYQLTNLPTYPLPRPMIHSHDFDFSFSGLKTAVLYMVKEIKDLTPKIKQEITKEFEDAVTEVLIKKTESAMEEHGVETLILGGGVISNTHIRRSFMALADKRKVPVYMPHIELSTDNGLMIALAGAFNQSAEDPSIFVADGNLKLGSHNTKITA